MISGLGEEFCSIPRERLADVRGTREVDFVPRQKTHNAQRPRIKLILVPVSRLTKYSTSYVNCAIVGSRVPRHCHQSNVRS